MPRAGAGAVGPHPRGAAPRLVGETVLVLGVSLGESALRAVLSIIDSLTRPEPINQQQTSLNNSVTPDRPWLDLAHQLVNVALPLLPVLLALYLLHSLHRPEQGIRATLGLDATQVPRDLGRGLLLAGAVGLPGVVFYFLTVQLGVNLNVSPSNLAAHWWTVPVYVLAAAMNGVVEEVIMVGYLFTRWFQAGWRAATVVVLSALIRGAYHLYQGFGGFAGNVVMGLVFGLVFLRTRRVLALVVAHTVMDVVVFVGYPLARANGLL